MYEPPAHIGILEAIFMLMQLDLHIFPHYCALSIPSAAMPSTRTDDDVCVPYVVLVCTPNQYQVHVKFPPLGTLEVLNIRGEHGRLDQ